MRTFSEAEARAVFARAAREQQAAHEAGAGGEGLTLDELQEIGRASGLDPAFVAAAAAGLGTSAAALRAPVTWLGMPVEVTRSRVLAAPLSDAAWEQTVADLRAQFGGPGITSQIGRVREWAAPDRSGLASGHSAYVAVRPAPGGGSEVTVEQRGIKDNATAIPALAGTFGAVALVISVVAAGGAEAPVLILAALFWACALLTVTVGVPGMRAWTRRLDARFEAALDRIELVARADAPPLLAETPDLGDDAAAHRSAPQIDLDALGDAPDTTRGDAARTRVR